MRAGLRQRKETVSAANEQDGCAVVSCASRRRVCQLRFGQDRRKIFREYFTGRLVDAYSMLVYQLSTQMSRVCQQPTTEGGENSSASARFFFPQHQRSRKERR